jgi:hypothetical protein
MPADLKRLFEDTDWINPPLCKVSSRAIGEIRGQNNAGINASLRV